MTLITHFFVPTDECADANLREINMHRLGRFVALAGKNGSGKTRILDKVEKYVAIRNDNLSLIPVTLTNLASWRANMSAQSPETQRQFQNAIANGERQIAITTERISVNDESQKFKTIRFVPKRLELADPRNVSRREGDEKSTYARNPGLQNYEQHCLFYLQHLQTRWWNADHQRFSGTLEAKAAAIFEYQRLQGLIERLLNAKLDRDANGDALLFGRPVPEAMLSDGQKVILQLCIALHAQGGELSNTVVLLDEPENHLHPSAVIALLKAIHEAANESQIWVATHSIPLLSYIASVEPMSLWYAEEGAVSNAGRRPEIVLTGLLGDGESIEKLNSFTGLPAQLAAINYATESLAPPGVIAMGQQDPQVNQIKRILTGRNEAPLSILDFGAGKGRLLDGLANEFKEAGHTLSSLDYFAYDQFSSDRDICSKVIRTHYPASQNRYFGSREEFFSSKQDQSISVVVMCNVLHEISPLEWLDLFSPQSLITRALRDDGYLLVVEDQRIPVGENANEYGFIVLDTSHLRTLFSVQDSDVSDGHFISDDYRGDGRLKAHLIAKSLLPRITSLSRHTAIEQLRATARERMKHLKTLGPTYPNGQLYGFWVQQFANSSLFLSEA